MAGSLQPRVKTWTATEDVTAADLNAEFNNVLLAMQPLLMDDYSTDVVQMQVQTDPGELGSESKATTLAGELARIRFMLKEITGNSYWYQSAVSSIAGLANVVGSGVTANRLISGRVRTNSRQPLFLVPNGAARSVKVDGTPTTFQYSIDAIEYSISSDVTLSGLTAAPSSNNTCLVNDALATGAPDWTRHAGENGTEIIVDTMGTEISALVGKFAAFKLAGAATEYFIAQVTSTTSLTKAFRGYFFDSADAPIVRTTYTNNDTITLMKLTWIFATTTGTLTATYNEPVWSDDEPTSPAVGDYWFDISANTWKIYSVGTYSIANATLIGVCIQDNTNTVAARSFEFFGNYAATNTMELLANTNSTVKSRYPGAIVNVWGASIKTERNLRTWDMTIDLDSGVTEAASTFYYFYLTETGDQVISNIKPYDRTEDLFGWYHPHQSWRCVGYAFNDASQNLGEVESYFRRNPAATVKSIISTDVLQKQNKSIPLSGSSFTTHLPPCALCRGEEFEFIHNGTTISSVYTFDGYGSETINGSLTTTINTKYETLILRSTGSEWLITRRSIPSEWISYTPTFVGFGTPSGVTFWYKRIGDSVLIRGFALSGIATAVQPTISLPSGLSIDTTKIPGNQAAYFGYMYGGISGTAVSAPASTRGPWPLIYDSDSATTLSICQAIDLDDVAFRPMPDATASWSTGFALAVDSSLIPIATWKG